MGTRGVGHASPLRSTGAPSLPRWLAIGGMAASVMFLPVVFAVGETRPGYSHVAGHISALSAAGTAAWAQNANLVLFGVLVAGLGLGLHLAINGGVGSPFGPALIAVTGIASGWGTAIFPEVQGGDPMTIVGVLHTIASVIAFGALALAMFVVMPQRLGQDPAWSNLIAPSRWLGVAATVCFFAFPFGVWDLVSPLEARTGLIQRLFAVAVLSWFFLLSVRLFQTSNDARAAAL
jgi:hypothetical membrane protein